MDKVVKLTGTIKIINKRSTIVFTTDNTEIQLTTKGYGDLPSDFRTKISTEGKKVIVKGTFIEFKDKKKGTVTKQLKYDSIDDVQFP